MRVVVVALLILVTIATALAQLKPFRQYPGREYGNFPLPPDWQQPAEWVFARLMYPAVSGGYGGRFRGRYGGGGGRWHQRFHQL